MLALYEPAAIPIGEGHGCATRFRQDLIKYSNPSGGDSIILAQSFQHNERGVTCGIQGILVVTQPPSLLQDRICPFLTSSCVPLGICLVFGCEFDLTPDLLPPSSKRDPDFWPHPDVCAYGYQRFGHFMTAIAGRTAILMYEGWRPADKASRCSEVSISSSTMGFLRFGTVPSCR